MDRVLTDVRPNEDRLLTEAICFAAAAHEGQTRKGSRIPFITHPMEAAAVAASMTDDRHVIAAAVLHDVLEDTTVTPEEIAATFGEDVLMLIGGDSENKRPELPPSLSWRTRKEETISYVKQSASLREKMVVLADKTVNLRALSRDHALCGDALWQRFNVTDPALHKWYYSSILQACEGLEDTAAYKECLALIRDTFGD